MLLRDKMFIISGKVDDSIKRQATLYDVTLFKDFTDFEKYVNKTPSVVDTIVITSDELAFNAVSVNRMQAVLSLEFLKLKGNIVYLIDQSYDLKSIEKFFVDNQLDKWVVYQGDLSTRFITEIVSGEGREQVEAQTEIVTYRMRASEYVRQKNLVRYEKDETSYVTDEEGLEGIPIEEMPELPNPVEDTITTVNYVVGEGLERTVMTFLLAQYRALYGKTLIIEKDIEYHTLTDMVAKTGIKCKLLWMEDVLTDVSKVLNELVSIQEGLVVIGVHKRIKYDYNFMMDLLEANLSNNFAYIIRECDYSEIPYGQTFTLVSANTVPAVIKCCNKIKIRLDSELVTYVGLQIGSLGSVNITSKEMRVIVAAVLGQNNVPTQVVKVKGIKLREEEVAYDLLSILNRGNRR